MIVLGSSGIKNPFLIPFFITAQVVMKMLVEKAIHANNMDALAESEEIQQRLKNKFEYFNEVDGCWYALTGIAAPICQSASILLRYKGSKTLARQTIQIPYPFAISKGLLYLWGLLAGSIRQKRNARVCLDANQEPMVQAVAAELGVRIRIVPVARSRKKYQGGKVLHRYRKIEATIPTILFKTLQCLGHRSNDPSIPAWFTTQQRECWLEGYLNSSKFQCQISRHHTIKPRITLSVSLALRDDLVAVLHTLGIGHSIYQTPERIQIIIQKRASIDLLTQKFTIRRPKFCATLALIKKLKSDTALRLGVHQFRLTEFQLTLYGVALAAYYAKASLEYTIFEGTFACSSNTIRQDLYALDKLGLLSYYEQENHKEYFELSTRYRAAVEETIKAEERELKTQLQYTETNALSFYCTACDHLIGYVEAMGDRTFECPHCHSTALRPVELSRYFFYGHLGVNIYHQRLLQEAEV